MDKTSIVKKSIADSINSKQQILSDEKMIALIVKLSDLIMECFKRKGKVLFCGNGGSAADAQHLAAEFTGRYYYDRPPLNAEALHVNTSYLTAVANDYSFDEVYARMVSGVGNKGDILIGLSTSGNSKNVVNALMRAKEIGMTTIGFIGNKGGAMKQHCDFVLEVPSGDTPRIQECHMLIGHAICELVEAGLFPR